VGDAVPAGPAPAPRQPAPPPAAPPGRRRAAVSRGLGRGWCSPCPH